MNPISIVKALKEVGRAVGVVSAVAGLSYLMEPEALQAVLDATGAVAPLLAVVLQFGLKYALDAIKHAE